MKCPWLTPLFSLLLLLGSPNTSAADAPVSVVAQRSTHDGLEQIALTFGDGRAELTTNSNFVGNPRDIVRLGRFESNLGKALSTRKLEIQNEKTRLERHGNTAALQNGQARSPHRTIYFLGGHELASGTPAEELAAEILSSAWRLAEWSPIDGVTVSYIQGSKKVRIAHSGSRPMQELSAGKCREEAEDELRCPIDSFGTAYLKR